MGARTERKRRRQSQSRSRSQRRATRTRQSTPLCCNDNNIPESKLDCATEGCCGKDDRCETKSDCACSGAYFSRTSCAPTASTTYCGKSPYWEEDPTGVCAKGSPLFKAATHCAEDSRASCCGEPVCEGDSGCGDPPTSAADPCPDPNPSVPWYMQPPSESWLPPSPPGWGEQGDESLEPTAFRA